jgi:sulfite exporter TauE/SafE
MILAALALGIVTSIHCAVMCGPLAVAACRGRGNDAVRYFGGRLLAYAAIGALFGKIGQHALCLLPVHTVQLVAVGVVAAAALVRALRLVRPPRPIALGRRRPLRLVARLWSLLPRDAFAVGMATGLLPCGMLLPAWALAMASGDAPSGAVTMASFALASSPGLVGALVGKRLLARARLSPRLEAAAWLALALWIVVRPLVVSAHCH